MGVPFGGFAPSIPDSHKNAQNAKHSPAVSFYRSRGNYISVKDTEFEAVFEEHKDAVYRFAWRMMNSAAAAEDIAQDVFLSLLKVPGRFDATRGHMRSFLLGITRNLVLKRWRDEHRWEQLDDEHFVGPSFDVER